MASNSPSHPPSYIAFEGGEGSGKTTQTRLLAARLGAVLTREPGGTPLGGRLRELLLNTEDVALGARAEALMMAADRAQHLEEIVLPALASGQHVVSDRSLYSSMAYQGAGRQLGIDAIASLNDWAIDQRRPDVVVLLTVPTDVSGERLDRSLDRIELAGADFHRRVGDAFVEMAAAEPQRWLVIDGTGSIDEVETRLWSALKPRL